MTCRVLVLDDTHPLPDKYRGVAAGLVWPVGISSLDATALGIGRGEKYATDPDVVSVYVQLCAQERLRVRVLATAPDPGDAVLTRLPTKFIGYDVCIRTLYSLVEQSVLLGVPEGTRGASLRPALNGFGLFDSIRSAERLRSMWKEDPGGFDVFGADDVDVLPLYWVLSLPGCDVELSQPQ